MKCVRRRLALVLATSIGCASSASAADAHWTYEGHDGPAEWGALSPDFATCGLGKHQSPIDIHKAKAADLPAIAFDYRPAPLAVIDNGHTIQVNYAPGSSINVGGARYELVQFHFHKPSEEKVDGKSHAMVVHLVHKNAEGKLAVVAVLLDGGGANAVVDSVLDNAPKQKQKELVVPSATVDASALLPPDHGYYTFQGSLTTPPCSEDVTWLVLKTPLRIAAKGIAEFAAIYPMNARPTQSLNHRLVQMSR